MDCAPCPAGLALPARRCASCPACPPATCSATCPAVPSCAPTRLMCSDRWLSGSGRGCRWLARVAVPHSVAPACRALHPCAPAPTPRPALPVLQALHGAAAQRQLRDAAAEPQAAGGAAAGPQQRENHDAGVVCCRRRAGSLLCACLLSAYCVGYRRAGRSSVTYHDAGVASRRAAPGMELPLLPPPLLSPLCCCCCCRRLSLLCCRGVLRCCRRCWTTAPAPEDRPSCLLTPVLRRAVRCRRGQPVPHDEPAQGSLALHPV